MTTKQQWIVWCLMTVGLVGYLAYSLVSQPSAAALTFLPGKTTHGHYQIEMQCSECHSNELGVGVRQDACVRCHGEDLERSNDTHPESKFTDPSKAGLLAKLDARSCISCHQEHVPDRTLAMGLSLPADYCWHCHEDVADERPSHAGMAYDSCATAGCHNYHDNRALFEKFLVEHHGEPDMLDRQRAPERTFAAEWAADHPTLTALTTADADGPPDTVGDAALVADWAETAHAAAGVNCGGCHQPGGVAWRDHPTHEACAECHATQVDTFVAGRHGMRLSVGLSPMTPGGARLPMNHDALHRELTCSACHDSHRFDTRHAAADACLKCHADEHSLAYTESSHYELWRAEVAGEGEPGSGVSCATCHMPREKDRDTGGVFVQHNQNNNLRPNEKMLRSACQHCHGLAFAIDALADSDLVRRNFQGPPAAHVESVDMAKAWFDEKARKREEAQRRRRERQLEAERRRAEQNAAAPAGEADRRLADR